jgi:glycosyltransferase involved in cell wall biosynthesis
MNPIVSIIIPNYNNTKYLSEIVECIKNQTLKDWELIKVDDCSTDGSYEYALSLGKSDRRITSVQRNRLPKGSQTCRNIGLDMAKGKYIIFFDSDDLISKDCLLHRVGFMEKNPSIDFSIFKAHSFKPRDDYYNLHKRDIVWGNQKVDDPLDAFLRNDYPFTVWTNIYLRESLKELSWDERIKCRQDLDFNLSVLAKGLKYEFALDIPFDYFYRGAFSTNNVSSNMTSSEKYDSMIYLFDKIIKRLSINELKNKYMISLRRYIINYFNSLLVSGTMEQTKDYIKHFCPVYPKWFIYRMQIAKHITDVFSNRNVKYFCSHFLLLILFHYKYYYSLIGKLMNRLIS